MSESYIAPLTASDGDNIAVQYWPLDEAMAPLGTILIVHGLGEHAGRYAQVAADFNSWGYNVCSYDQVGHGESAGARGDLPHATRLQDDLADVVDTVRRQMLAQEPLVVLGHSMGGVVAGHFVRSKTRRIEGLILSSPAFDPGTSAMQKTLLATLPRFAPHLCLGNGLNPQYLCRDKAVVAAYLQDPLVHDRISTGLASYLATQGAQCIAAAAHWSMPTLLVYAGADRLVSPAGSRAFAAAAPGKIVQSQCFDAMFHEILNDSERGLVLSVVRNWLDGLRA